MTANATITELKIHKLAGYWVNKFVTFSQLGFFDQRTGGHAIISLVDFKDEVTIKKYGIRVIKPTIAIKIFNVYLPIIGDKVKNQELKDYQTKEVEKYLKDEISDKDIVAILNENPKLKKAIEDVATSGLNYKDYYQLIKELGGAANKWGDAHRKFKQLRKKISDGKVLESVITEANGQTVKEFGDLLALLLDEDSGMDIERAIIAMPPKNARVLEKQISTLYKKLFDLTNQGFDLREDE